jgi:UDP-glucose 4-epimerase
MTDTVLVTGGAGFIGSHLTDALVADHEVRVLDDYSTGKRARVPDAARAIEGDVTDPATVARAMHGVDVVFHQAANVSVERSIEAPRESRRSNVDGTLTVLDRARDEDARVVLASSAAIYGHPSSVPVEESAPKTPASPYGLEKLTADHYARLYQELYGIETVALRYFNVYGPRHGGGEYSGVIDVFLEQARANDPITVHGDGDQTRDFVHVRDVVQANLRAATTPHVGEAFNVGTGRSVSIRGLAELVCDVTDSESEIRHTEPRAGDIERSRADISKVRARMGYRPTVRLRDGIAALATDDEDLPPITDVPTDAT